MAAIDERLATLAQMAAYKKAGEFLETLKRTMIMDSQGRLANSNLIRSLGISKASRDSQGNWHVLVGTNVKYARYVERGRRAGGRRPPVRMMLEWINRRNMQPPAGMTAEQFAWAISKNIAYAGTKPLFFFRHAVRLFKIANGQKTK